LHIIKTTYNHICTGIPKLYHYLSYKETCKSKNKFTFSKKKYLCTYNKVRNGSILKLTNNLLYKNINLSANANDFKTNFSYKERLQYTIAHRKAFRQIEKELLGKNTIKGYLHDSNKVFMYLIGIPTNIAHKIHQLITPHHVKNGKVKDPISAIVDWECARYTKPDKTLNAFDFYKQNYPNGIPKIEETMKKLGLWQE